MRPEDFSPGNLPGDLEVCAAAIRFNEAGGFLPRKRIVVTPMTRPRNQLQ